MVQGYQTPKVLVVGVVQPITAAQPDNGPMMSANALKRLDKFQKLFPPHFSGVPSENARDFLDHCHEIL